MKAEIKDQWIAALRSGEYKQARNVLTDSYGHCCLGVLCELAAKEGVVKREAQEVDGEYTIVLFDGSRYYLPKSVQDWAGLDNSVGRLRDSEEITVGEVTHDNLSNANDEGRSFTEIADAIEANWGSL